MNRTSSSFRLPALPALREAIIQHVKYSLAKEWGDISVNELLQGVSLAVRDRMVAASAKVVDELGGALERTLAALEPYILQLRLEMGAANA